MNIGWHPGTKITTVILSPVNDASTSYIGKIHHPSESSYNLFWGLMYEWPIAYSIDASCRLIFTDDKHEAIPLVKKVSAKKKKFGDDFVLYLFHLLCDKHNKLITNIQK